MPAAAAAAVTSRVRLAFILGKGCRKRATLALALTTLLLTVFYHFFLERIVGNLPGEWSAISAIATKRDSPRPSINASDSESEDRYITANFGYCGRLGNLMFRFASLYGIGRKVGRRVYFADYYGCYRDFRGEAEELFPQLAQQLFYPDPPPEEDRVVIFASDHCCKYVDPLSHADLVATTEKYVRISGNYLQHYRFFADSDREIRRMLTLAPALLEKVQRRGREIFTTHSHKLCVHLRVSDFPPEAVSEVPFVWAAINYTSNTLLGSHCHRRHRNHAAAVSVLLLGDEPAFVRELQHNLSSATASGQLHLEQVFHLLDSNMSRNEEFAFAATHCDSLLITAPASTYAWWIGYLMMGRWATQTNSNEDVEDESRDHRGGLILYNGDVPRRTFGGGSHFRDNFPPQWVPLLLRENDGDIVVLPVEEGL